MAYLTILLSCLFFLAVLFICGFLVSIVHIGIQYRKRCKNDIEEQDLVLPDTSLLSCVDQYTDISLPSMSLPSISLSSTSPHLTSTFVLKNQVPHDTIEARFLPCVKALHSQIYDTILQARKEVLIVTYRWRFEKDPLGDVIGHIKAIGSALQQLDRLNMQIDVKILSNQMVLGGETDDFIKEQIFNTLQYWNISSNIKIHFRLWKHRTLGNIHDKFIVVDQTHCLIHSMNVEASSHGQEGSWRECGLFFSDKKRAASLVQHFNHLFLQSHDVKNNIMPTTKDRTAVTDFISFDSKYELLPMCSISNLNVYSRVPDAYSTSRRNDVTLHLVRMLHNAKKSIDILTPNFNDIALLEACSKVPTRVLWSRQFNVSVPWLQELLLGWSTNERMKSQFAKRPNIQVRWNGENDSIVFGKISNALHAKLYLIDDEWLITGSVNADVYSTITSGETIVSVQSKELVLFAKQQCFEPWWAKGKA